MNADNSIGFGLLQVAAIMSHHADQTLQSNLNFGYSQYKILSVIIEAGRYRQVDIAGILGQTEASISRQIKLMESDELVKIKLNANNRREHLVYVTLKVQEDMKKLQEYSIIYFNQYSTHLVRIS